MFRTINARFIFFTIAFILLSVGIPTTFLIYQLRENFDQRSKAMLASTIDVVKGCIRNSMMMGSQKHIPTSLYNVAQNATVDHIRIIKENGVIQFSSDSTERGKNVRDILHGHRNWMPGQLDQFHLLEDRRVYSITTPILNESRCQSCHENKPILAYLDVDTDLTKAEVYFYTGSTHMIFLAVVIILVLSLGFYYLFRIFINKPLNTFKMALEDVEKGNLNIKLPAQSNDEIAVLNRQFNEMVQNLKESKQQIDELHFEQLQRADKLVTLGELAAEMAHEINNPAGIIMARADYLQMGMEDKQLKKKYEEDLEVIINQVNKISKITGNILKYSKKLPKKFTHIDLKQISEESLQILEPRLTKKNIKVLKKFDAADTFIQGDPIQMEQVFTNLVNNAIDAIGENGQLLIGIHRNEDNQLIWILEDNGSGMNDQIREQIFSPFFTTKTANKGTGLGLYIVKNICKNHNAGIYCQSEPNKGTKFQIVFKS